MFAASKKTVQRHFVELFGLTTLLVFVLGNCVSAEEMQFKVGLDGYCPVCVVAAGKWEQGSAEISSTYDGVSYQFPNEELKQEFEQSPASFAPALGGDCIVCLVDAGKRVAGNVNFAIIAGGRLFLFPNDATKATFEANPAKYQNADIAANGNCVVCRGQNVKGLTEFTEMHHGMRYLFPAADAAAVFRAAPEKYAVSESQNAFAASVAADSAKAKLATAMSPELVSVTGKSTCAACEFGVKPLGNPEELGMAVRTAAGQVVVIEGAHALYPEIYKARYGGQDVRVEGQILKSKGRVSWLTPSSIRVID